MSQPTERETRNLLRSLLRRIQADRRYSSLPTWRYAAFDASHDVATVLQALINQSAGLTYPL